MKIFSISYAFSPLAANHFIDWREGPFGNMPGTHTEKLGYKINRIYRKKSRNIFFTLRDYITYIPNISSCKPCTLLYFAHSFVCSASKYYGRVERSAALIFFLCCWYFFRVLWSWNCSRQITRQWDGFFKCKISIYFFYFQTIYFWILYLSLFQDYLWEFCYILKL